MKAPKILFGGSLLLAGAHSVPACSNIADDCRATLTCPPESSGGSASASGGEPTESGAPPSSEGGRNTSSGGSATGGGAGRGSGEGMGGGVSAGGSLANHGGNLGEGGNEGAGGNVTTSLGGAAGGGSGGVGSGGASSGGVANRGGSVGSGGSGGAPLGGGSSSRGGAAGGGKGGTTGAGGSSGAPNQCGNGRLEGEACDDGNRVAGDGCSTGCTAETGWTCPGGTVTSRSVCNRSCAGTTVQCQGGDCCESPLVAGGTFTQGPDPRDSPDKTFSAQVSDYRLDRYEVTVGRFRKFVSGYDAWRSMNNPASGDGANASISGSGWNAAWTTNLPANAAVLTSNLKCDSTSQTWLDGLGNDALPMNCVNWYEAFAFCIWDGGRLPTESEWEYAAVGGASDYRYPWGNAPVLDNTQATAHLAVYGCLSDGSAYSECAATDILKAGSKAAGQGVYLQRDLVGSMSEWVLDTVASYPSAASVNYAKVDVVPFPVVRGGSWRDEAFYVPSAYRGSIQAENRGAHSGLRCARTR